MSIVFVKSKSSSFCGGDHRKTSPDRRHKVCFLLNLPLELLYLILSLLRPIDLVSVQATCRWLYRHASCDNLWKVFVHDHVDFVVPTPWPHSSFGALVKCGFFPLDYEPSNRKQSDMFAHGLADFYHLMEGWLSERERLRERKRRTCNMTIK